MKYNYVSCFGSSCDFPTLLFVLGCSIKMSTFEPARQQLTSKFYRISIGPSLLLLNVTWLTSGSVTSKIYRVFLIGPSQLLLNVTWLINGSVTSKIYRIFLIGPSLLLINVTWLFMTIPLHASVESVLSGSGHDVSGQILLKFNCIGIQAWTKGYS
jgi:hypothetical protein